MERIIPGRRNCKGKGAESGKPLLCSKKIEAHHDSRLMNSGGMMRDWREK